MAYKLMIKYNTSPPKLPPVFQLLEFDKFSHYVFLPFSFPILPPVSMVTHSIDCEDACFGDDEYSSALTQSQWSLY